MRPLCALLLALACLAPRLAPALSSDREKPTQIEANRMSADDMRRLNIFEGDVVLTRGTLVVHADRIVVREDAEGNQYATATGSPVRFKQKLDPKQGDKQERWLEGEAQRIEIDDHAQKIELFDHARVDRAGDEVKGDYILVDQASDFFSVSPGKEAPGKEAQGGSGRVRAVIQPRAEDAKK